MKYNNVTTSKPYWFKTNTYYNPLLHFENLGWAKPEDASDLSYSWLMLMAFTIYLWVLSQQIGQQGFPGFLHPWLGQLGRVEPLYL